MYSQIIFFLIVSFNFSHTLIAQNELSIFNNLIDKTWIAEGTWIDGSRFKQEISFKSELNNQLIITESQGYINEAKTKWGKRNIGNRTWNKEMDKYEFVEYDIFGNKTKGTVTSNDNGDIIYSYFYGGTQLTDYWKKINDYKYEFIVGQYEKNQWVKKYLTSEFVDKDFIRQQKRYKDFDFWIGDWIVYNYGTDKIAGFSSIKSILNGKGIEENYETPNGSYKGTSLNKYNPQTNKWQQFWIDNSGLTLELNGGLENDKMILYGLTKIKEGIIKNRITWYQNEDQTVRQIWDQIKETDSEWKNIFDGHYKKKE